MLIIAAVIALAALGFGKALDTKTSEDVIRTAVTADAPLGLIPCPDGSTVNFGEFCPLPTVDRANGTKVVVGQWCPIGGARRRHPTTSASQLGLGQ